MKIPEVHRCSSLHHSSPSSSYHLIIVIMILISLIPSAHSHHLANCEKRCCKVLFYLLINIRIVSYRNNLIWRRNWCNGTQRKEPIFFLSFINRWTGHDHTDCITFRFQWFQSMPGTDIASNVIIFVLMINDFNIEESGILREILILILILILI